ncbi:MAG: hypothetical protein K0R09_478 [Clostridiales bacterium]|jgi:ABC-type transport system involved in multi-copper enzyme maturation permease subunit|nr:hypothetical protein [Clostridiales bacterium]
MKSVLILLKRDFKNSINKRVFLLLGFMVLLQAWFILGSGSVNNVVQSRQMTFMEIVFSFNLFGSIVALALSFDSISLERENKVMDLILTSNISKKKVLLSKTLNCFLVSCAFAILYVLLILVIYLSAAKDIRVSLLALRYILPITAFLSIYCLMGLVLSIIFRSSKESLIISVILGGLFIPRLYLLVAEGIGNALGFEEKSIDMLSMLSPALIMNALSGYAEKSEIFLGVLLLIVYLVVMISLSIIVFTKQDELNYGE